MRLWFGALIYLELRVFLVCQYFVNGYTVPDSELKKVRQGTKTFKFNKKDETMKIGGKTYNAPKGWEKRKKYYKKAVKNICK